MTKGRELAWMLIILFLTPMFSGCTDIVNSNSPPTPKMSVEPSGLKKAGDSILFSAIGTSDPDADSMSFVWTFGDGSYKPSMPTVLGSLLLYRLRVCLRSLGFCKLQMQVRNPRCLKPG